MPEELDPLGIGIPASLPVGVSEVQEPASSNGEVTAIDLLKQDFDELVGIQYVDIPVVGFEKARLTVRYHMPKKGSDLDEVAKKITRDMKGQSAFSRNVRIGIDTMILLCEGLYVQPEGTDEPVAVDPYNDGTIANFGDLAEIFGWDDVPTVAQMIQKLFNNNDMALLTHVEKLNRWLMDTKTDITLEFWQTGE